MQAFMYIAAGGARKHSATVVNDAVRSIVRHRTPSQRVRHQVDAMHLIFHANQVLNEFGNRLPGRVVNVSSPGLAALWLQRSPDVIAVLVELICKFWPFHLHAPGFVIADDFAVGFVDPHTQKCLRVRPPFGVKRHGIKRPVFFIQCYRVCQRPHFTQDRRDCRGGRAVLEDEL